VAKPEASENPIDPIRVGFGMRLKAAREGKKLSQVQVAEKFGLNKATVSAWETGRGDPGVYRLRELAKLYGVSAQGLLWENSLTIEAMQMAAQFDGLNESQRRTLAALWVAYIAESSSDAEVERKMPITVATKQPGVPGASEDEKE
jgi:transcriptional regulator with XRE-family HTH domain